MPLYDNPSDNAPVLTAPSAGPQPAYQPKPDEMLDAQWHLLQTETTAKEQRIQQMALPVTHKQQMMYELQSQYDQRKNSIMGQRQQLLAVKQLKDQGALDDDGAMRASWRVVLPNDVEQIVAPKPRQINRGVPPSVSEIDSKEIPTMSKYIDPLKGMGNWLESIGGGGKIPGTDLNAAYHNYAADTGLMDRNAATQDVLNRRWDNLMHSDSRTRDTWDPNHPDVLALRPTGPLQKIMASSMSARILPRTPLGQSVQNANQGITQRLRKEEPSNPAYADELKDVAPGESSVGTSNAVAAGTPGPMPSPTPVNMPAPKTKAEYDVIPKGTRYREPSGRESIKR